MKLQNFFNFILLTFFLTLSCPLFAKENINHKLKKLTLELRCMTCQNQSVYESESEFANDIKKLVKEKLKDGLDEKEIKYFLTERYGEYILFKPYFSLKNLLLWLFPFILAILSMLVFIRKLKKNQSK